MLDEEVADRPAARRLTAQVARGIADLNHLVSNILDYTRLPEPRRTRGRARRRLIDEALLASGPALGRGHPRSSWRPPRRALRGSIAGS